MTVLSHTAVCFWLRRQTTLIIKGTVEFAFIEQTCACSLFGESSICEYIFFFPWVFGWLFDAQLPEVCYHSIPESKNPWGLWRLHVHAVHKQGHDRHIWPPQQLIYTAALQKHQLPHACCVKHSTEPWPKRDVRTPMHNTGSYTPGSFTGDQMTLSVMIVGEPQFDPRIFPSDGTVPGFLTSGVTLLGIGCGFSTSF